MSGGGGAGVRRGQRRDERLNLQWRERARDRSGQPRQHIRRTAVANVMVEPETRIRFIDLLGSKGPSSGCPHRRPVDKTCQLVWGGRGGPLKALRRPRAELNAPKRQHRDNPDTGPSCRNTRPELTQRGQRKEQVAAHRNTTSWWPPETAASVPGDRETQRLEGLLAQRSETAVMNMRGSEAGLGSNAQCCLVARSALCTGRALGISARPAAGQKERLEPRGDDRHWSRSHGRRPVNREAVGRSGVDGAGCGSP